MSNAATWFRTGIRQVLMRACRVAASKTNGGFAFGATAVCNWSCSLRLELIQRRSYLVNESIRIEYYGTPVTLIPLWDYIAIPGNCDFICHRGLEEIFRVLRFRIRWISGNLVCICLSHHWN
jgi:hypothetical protein